MRIEAILLFAILLSSIYSSAVYGQTPQISIETSTGTLTQDLTEATYSVIANYPKSGDWVELWLYPPSGQSFSSADQSRVAILVTGTQKPVELKIDSSGMQILSAKISPTYSSDVGGLIIYPVSISVASGAPSGTYKISGVIMPNSKATANANMVVNPTTPPSAPSTPSAPSAPAQSTQSPTIDIAQLSVASTQDLTEAEYSVTTSNLKSGDWLELWVSPPSGQSIDLSKVVISAFGSKLPLEKLDSNGSPVLVAKIPITLSSDYVGGKITNLSVLYSQTEFHLAPTRYLLL